MHTEKIKIFDEYAQSQGYDDWYDLQANDAIYENEESFLNHIFAACDLVQKEQQKRIAESISKLEYDKGHFFDTASILSENNLIK